MDRVNLGHYVVGMEGVALLRSYLSANKEKANTRVAEIRQFVTTPDQPPLVLRFKVPEVDVHKGYAAWATTYDTMPNPLISLEEPPVRALIDSLPIGKAVDAACGTGRHTKYLHDRGHTVVGLDTSPEMLKRAREALPSVELHVGDLSALPLASGSMDFAVCSLALTHCPDLCPPIQELARVVRPGGHIILSDFHPFMGMLGGAAFFLAADGSSGYVTGYVHHHSAYWQAFITAGLEVLQCKEPVNGENEVVLMSSGMMDIAGEAFRSALLGVPGALIWLLRRR